MNFKELLYRARQGDEDAILEIFEMYRPLLKPCSLSDMIVCAVSFLEESICIQLL